MKRLFVVIGFLLLFFNAKAQTNVLAVADNLYNYGNYAKAISYYNQLEDALPYSQQIAKSYVFLGNYDQAITYYNNGLNSNRSNALLKFEFCKLLIQTGKLQEAVESFNKQFPGSKYTPILNVKLAELKSQAFQNKSE